MEEPTLMLPILMLVPLVIGLLLLAIPRDQAGWIRAAAAIGTIVPFFLSLWMLVEFHWDEPGLIQLVSALDWVPRFGLTFGFGVDAISLWLVLLTTFLMPLVVIGSFSAVTDRLREYYMWMLVLEAAMIGVFVATDIIFFYVCFEFTLVPMYFLIGIYGSTERLKAARVFFLYTFTGSMLTFAGVLYVAWWNASLDMNALVAHLAELHPGQTLTQLQLRAQQVTEQLQGIGEWNFNIAHLVEVASHPRVGLPFEQQMWVLLAMLAGFAVKVPLFPVHTWLPLAHTEAPTGGSVVLAGVLLKLGTYALLRLAVPMTPDAVLAAAPYIGVFAVIGILYTALICWVQKDIKKLIAYSSVSHLGFCILGLFALNTIGITGSVMYMVNHGLSTGALFLCVGMIYERFHTREMRQMGGLARVMPVWSSFMVFFVLASVGLPGLNGFVSEFLTLLGAFSSGDVLGPSFAAAAGFGMIFGAIYLLYMVGKVVFGPVTVPVDHDHAVQEHKPAEESHAADEHHTPALPHVRDLKPREIAVLLPLALGCLWLGLYPKPVLDSLEPPVNLIVAGVRGPEAVAGSTVAEKPGNETEVKSLMVHEAGEALPGEPSLDRADATRATLAAHRDAPAGGTERIE